MLTWEVTIGIKIQVMPYEGPGLVLGLLCYDIEGIKYQSFSIMSLLDNTILGNARQYPILVI